MQIKIYDYIQLTVFGTDSVANISKTDPTGSYYDPITIGNGTNRTIEFTSDFNGYVAVSYNNNNQTYPRSYLHIIDASSGRLYDAIGTKQASILKRYGVTNNKLIEGMAHQGINVGHGVNSMSAFWAAIAKGFDTILCNMVWTSDNVPVCDHDGYFTDTVTGNTVVIAETTYANLQNARRFGEIVPRFEDVVYLCKMYGKQMMSANAPDASETGKWSIVWNILDKYRMSNHIQWVSVHGSAQIESILAHNPNASILLFLANVTESALNALVTTANNYGAEYPNGTFVLWLNLANADIDAVVNLIKGVNVNLKSNVKMGVCFATAENYVKIAPYIDVFHSDTITTGDMVDITTDAVMEAYPQLQTFRYYESGLT